MTSKSVEIPSIDFICATNNTRKFNYAHIGCIMYEEGYFSGTVGLVCKVHNNIIVIVGSKTCSSRALRYHLRAMRTVTTEVSTPVL